jgi:hypothetical protein
LWFAIDDSFLAKLDEQVDIAQALGMYIIIDYHPVPCCKPIYSQEPWRSDIVEFWDTVAPRYKDRTHVVYEVKNEGLSSTEGWDDPVARAQHVAKTAQFHDELYVRIRAAAPDTHLIAFCATGRALSESMEDTLTALALATQVDYANASVAYHPYVDPGEMMPLVQQLISSGRPVMATEVGRMEDVGKPGVVFTYDGVTGDVQPRILAQEDEAISWQVLGFEYPYADLEVAW